MSFKNDPEWQAIKFDWARIIDNGFRWPMIYRLMGWIVRLTPETPAGRKVMRAIAAVSKECLADALAEATANKARIEAKYPRKTGDRT